MLVSCVECKKPIFISSASVAVGIVDVGCSSCNAELVVNRSGAVDFAAHRAPSWSEVTVISEVSRLAKNRTERPCSSGETSVPLDIVSDRVAPDLTLAKDFAQEPHASS